MSDTRPNAGETLVHQNREPGKNFDLLMPEAVTTIHVDGVAGVVGGGVSSRIEFFVTESAEPDPDPNMGLRERRVIRLRVAVPSPQLIEGLINIMSLMQPQADQLRIATQGQDQLMAAQVERLKAIKF